MLHICFAVTNGWHLNVRRISLVLQTIPVRIINCHIDIHVHVHIEIHLSCSRRNKLLMFIFYLLIVFRREHILGIATLFSKIVIVLSMVV